MNSLAKRLIITFTSIPALFSLIYFLPYKHHLAFAVLACLAVLQGTYEMKGMLFLADDTPLLPFWIAILMPLSQYVCIATSTTLPLVELVFSFLVLLVGTMEIFRGEMEQFSHTLSRISRSVFLFTYPGFFSIFLVRIIALKESSWLLVLLFLLVFGNDIFAYVFGMLFGNSNRNIFAVSPNKSIAGFIGGAIMGIVLSVVFVYVVGPIYQIITPFEAVFLGLIVAIASDAGDLVESACKRGSRVKDSGHIILGRGGLMDSIDSLIAAAPFFYLLVTIYIG